jgi:hypothetical protein
MMEKSHSHHGEKKKDARESLHVPHVVWESLDHQSTGDFCFAHTTIATSVEER